MKRAEIYRKAADVIRERGWRQWGDMSRTRCCMNEAIAVAQGRPKVEWRSASISKELLSVVGGDPSLHPITRVYAFNDTPDMTKDDAIAALEIAADLAS